MNAGFTIARNVIKADYPIKEAIFSVMPLVDEFVVAVGHSDDGTRDYIESLNSQLQPGWPTIKIIDTVWDDNLREGGKVLADETNKAKAAVSPQATWLIYIQADECLHQADYTSIKDAMEKYKNVSSVEGFLFNYLHFYGSYDFVGDSRRWYRKEIRIIRNSPGIKSWKDAQGFRWENQSKLQVVPIDATVFHYGWVKHPKFQQQKQRQFHRLWHSDEALEKRKLAEEEFDYSQIDSLIAFEGTHPDAMNARVNSVNWSFKVDPTLKKFGVKAAVLYWIEKKFGWRIGEYKNYKLFKA
ncbi:MAG: glycosyltransferase family 2 protein [Bacteroidota bacterium]|jgi:hypothetical protein